MTGYCHFFPLHLSTQALLISLLSSLQSCPLLPSLLLLRPALCSPPPSSSSSCMARRAPNPSLLSLQAVLHLPGSQSYLRTTLIVPATYLDVFGNLNFKHPRHSHVLSVLGCPSNHLEHRRLFSGSGPLHMLSQPLRILHLELRTLRILHSAC